MLGLHSSNINPRAATWSADCIADEPALGLEDEIRDALGIVDFSGIVMIARYLSSHHLLQYCHWSIRFMSSAVRALCFIPE